MNKDATDPSLTAEARSKFENWTAFLAQLTARSAADDDSPFDFSLFALWSMRSAFEEDGGADSETAVKLAALWVRFAGEHLRKLSADGERLPQNCGLPGSKYAECGWRGYNNDRWKAWTDELKVAQSKLAPDETIQAASELMDTL